jgi:hypothetical protein
MTRKLNPRPMGEPLAFPEPQKWQKYIAARSAPNGNGCWMWKLGIKTNGYGSITVRHGKTNQTYHAHRVSYAAYCGDIPAGAIIMHTCDVRACVNPKHLQIGTMSDNSKDAYRKKRLTTPRSAFGEDHKNAKLTWSAVREIRSRVAAGEEQKSVGRDMGCSPGNVWKIVHGYAWVE